MDTAAGPALDPSDLRAVHHGSAAHRPTHPWQGPRLWMLAGIGALGLGAAVAGASVWLSSGASRSRIASVKMGPLDGLPEIKDGVPGLVGPKPIRVISTAPAGTTGATPAPALPGAAAPVPSALTQALATPNGLPPDAPAPKAMELAGPATTASLSSRPTVARSAAPEAAGPRPPAPASTSPTPAASQAGTPLPPRAPEKAGERASAAITVAAVKSGRPSDAKIERTPSAPPRALAAKPEAVKTADVARVEAVKADAAKIETARPDAARSKAAKPEGARPESTRAGKLEAGKAGKADAKIDPPKTETAAREEPDEGVQVFGITVLPSGRQIRDAAQSFADAVSGK